MAATVDLSPLGKITTYVTEYDASLLFPIARSSARKQFSLPEDFVFHGCDLWSAYEISWLNLKGKPQVAVAEFTFPCNSPAIVESKSFKLYLNSFNQTQFADMAAVKVCMEQDLTTACGAPVGVNLQTLAQSRLLLDFTHDTVCLDDLDIEVNTYQPQTNMLSVVSAEPVTERLCSHLLKSNCPVTGQPDWASLFINYTGSPIDHDNLLRYIVSFRDHQDFHEHCVERIFVDILAQCKPSQLSVYARYTRRGGLDINPFRSTDSEAQPSVGRLLRQ